jgi:hypothetical protein
VNQLPAHTELTLAFDLLVIRSWDGNWGNGCCGPDVFDLRVAGAQTPLVHTSFANGHPFSVSSGQAYPDDFPGGSHPIRTGAAENYTLGYVFDTAPISSRWTRSIA